MTIEEAIRDFLARGFTKRQAATELGITTATLIAYIREYDIPWPVAAHGRHGQMPTHIGRNREKIEAIEKEYGTPVLDVICQFAKDGESHQSTAAILGLSRSAMSRLINGHPIPWPKRSNAQRVAGNRGTPAIVEAARRNLAKARAKRHA